MCQAAAHWHQDRSATCRLLLQGVLCGVKQVVCSFHCATWAMPLFEDGITWCRLPCHRDALMYVQAVGWQLARKDKIDLDSDTLHQKQGLYTCPPSTEGQKPFHCCLQVQEEPINVRR